LFSSGMRSDSMVLSGVLLYFGTVFAAGFTAYLIRGVTHWPAYPFAGIVGSLVATFFCWSSGEVYVIGSLDWAIRGGLYGAAWGLPIAGILGPLALTNETDQGKPIAPPEVSQDVSPIRPNDTSRSL
jgi:hypothetical protein